MKCCKRIFYSSTPREIDKYCLLLIIDNICGHNESIRHVGQECFLLRQVNLMMTKYHLRYLMVICNITRTINFLNSWWFISYQHTLYSCQKYFKTIFFLPSHVFVKLLEQNHAYLSRMRKTFM